MKAGEMLRAGIDTDFWKTCPNLDLPGKWAVAERYLPFRASSEAVWLAMFPGLCWTLDLRVLPRRRNDLT